MFFDLEKQDSDENVKFREEDQQVDSDIVEINDDRWLGGNERIAGVKLFL